MAKSEPRYEPQWMGDGAAELIGHAGELDVWVDTDGDGRAVILVVGPAHRARGSQFNYDAYHVRDGTLLPPQPEWHDVHVELAELCEVYQLGQEHGVFEAEEK